MWPWMLIVGGLQVMAGYGAPDMGDIEKMEPRAAVAALGNKLWLMLLTTALQTVAFSSIAVNWHRYLLLDEVPQGLKLLRLDGTMWRYIWKTFQLQLVTGVLALLAFYPLLMAAEAAGGLAGGSKPEVVYFAVIALAVLLAIVALQRLYLTLPAVAIGREDYGIMSAWLDSGGNNLRLLGFFLLLFCGITLPVLVLTVPLLLVLHALGTDLGAWGAFLFLQCASWLAVITGVTMLSTLYAIFAEDLEI